MKFKKVELHAFRAYTNKENGTFDFTLPNDKIANFISIYAPNGFGKTSFYDGVEWGMTNQISRFKKSDSDLADEERQYISNENQHREKQFILRNKYVDDSTIGFVNIETDIKEYRREIPFIERAGGKDYFKDSIIENKFFKNVVLSQDGIDDFLKSDNSKVRYEKFSFHFIDDDLLNHYSNIRVLEKENNRKIEEIKNTKTTIDNFLKKSIDKKVFNFSNEKIKELNKNNSSYLLIDDSFNEVEKSQFESKLNEEVIKINKQIKDKEFLKIELSNWVKNSSEYFNNKKKLEESKKRLADYEELKICDDGIEFIDKEQVCKKALKLKLEILHKNYINYKTISDEIDSNEKILEDEEQKLIKLEIKNNELTKDFKNLKEKVETTERKKNKVDKLVEEIPKYYSEIKRLSLDIEEAQKVLNENSKNKDNINALEIQKSKIMTTRDNIKNNIFLDIESDKKYKNKVLEIEKLIKENDNFLLDLAIVKKSEDDYKEYDNQLNKLLSIGMILVDEKKSDICPLCNTKQESYDILKEKIVNNPFLEKLEKELLEKKNKILNDIEINNRKIEEKKNFILLELNKKIKIFKTNIIEVRHKNKYIDNDKLEESISRKEQLLSKTENQSEEEFLSLKVKEQSNIKTQLESLYRIKNDKEIENNISTNNITLLRNSIASIKENINIFKNEEIYLKMIKWLDTFEQNSNVSSNILELLNSQIIDIDNSLNSNSKKLSEFKERKEKISGMYKLPHRDNKLLNDMSPIEYLNNKLDVEIKNFEVLYEQYFLKKIYTEEAIKNDINKKYEELNKKIKLDKDRLVLIQVLKDSTNKILEFIEHKNKKKELEALKSNLEVKEEVSEKLADERKKVEEKIENDVKAFFQEDLINQIYEKIDPHPDYKRVKFKCSVDKGVGKLNVFVNDIESSKHISPSLYYSTAQLNVLSLSIFLAKALNVKDDEGNSVDCIFIDDPIQSMDSINILSTIDLLRSLVVNFDKQIILSTHDENFHRLLEKKIPTEYFDSKFIEFETFGKVKKYHE